VSCFPDAQYSLRCSGSPAAESVVLLFILVFLAGGRWEIHPPGTDKPSGCCSVQVAAEPLGKASFKCRLAHRTIFGCT
jgi:hypothetical protein